MATGEREDKNIRIPDTDKSRIKRAYEIRGEALSEAQRYFGIASSMHFELEEIYGQSMNFDILDEIYAKKSEEILKLMR